MSAPPGRKFGKKTLELVDESLTVWEAKLCRADLINIPMGCYACPLCVEFRDMFDAVTPCGGCPVVDVSGRNCCNGTPYPAAARALSRAADQSLDTDARAEELLKWHKAARREITFLRQVRKYVLTT